jgi:hypothetical protein
MNLRNVTLITAATFFGIMVTPMAGFSEAAGISGETIYSLGGELSRETQYYIQTSEMVSYAPDGSRAGKDIYRLYLKVTPIRLDGKDTFEYTCVRFIIQPNGVKEASIPVLANWRYVPVMGIDSQNQIFGIDHERFRDLTDSGGKELRFEKTYYVFNTFVDFHSFISVFVKPALKGQSIQDLHRVGEKIIHHTAFSSAPVHLGKSVDEGSFFKNGEITLEFKGLSVVNGCPCALLGMDSGVCSLKMTMKPMADMSVTATGSSHYKGDIYTDLTTNWVQKAAFDEIVVNEITVPSISQKIHSVIERNILIRNVSKTEFEKH